RGVDLSTGRRGAELRGAAEGGLADGVLQIGPLGPGRPMAGGGETCKRHGVVRVAAGLRLAGNELDVFGRHVELRCGEVYELGLQTNCTDPSGAAHGSAKPAPEVARPDLTEGPRRI